MIKENINILSTESVFCHNVKINITIPFNHTIQYTEWKHKNIEVIEAKIQENEQ